MSEIKRGWDQRFIEEETADLCQNGENSWKLLVPQVILNKAVCVPQCLYSIDVYM